MATNEDDVEYPIVEDFRKTAILLLDCHEIQSMQTALKSAFKYYDGSVMFNRARTNNLEVLLCHSDVDKQVLVDSKTSALDAYKTLFKIAGMSVGELESSYKVNNQEPFSPHLLNAMKHVRDQHTVIMYATARSDPTTDVQDRFQAMAHFNDMNTAGTHFKVLPLNDSLDFSVFYEEVYATLGQTLLQYYYNMDNLCETLVDAIHIKEHTRSFDMYPYLGCPTSLKLYRTNVTRDWTHHPTTAIHKTTLDVLQTEALPPEDEADGETMYFVKLGKNGEQSVAISEDEYRGALRVDAVPMGITLLEAKSRDEEPYAVQGMSLHATMLLGGNSKDPAEFVEFWEAVKDLRIWCLFKFTRAGCVHNVELDPVKIDSTRYFLARFIPGKNEQFLAMGAATPPEAEASLARQALLDELIHEFDIENFEPILRNLCPPKVAKEMEYVKQQLLGNEYQPASVVDYTDVKWYDGDSAKIVDCCQAMEDISVRAAKKRRR